MYHPRLSWPKGFELTTGNLIYPLNSLTFQAAASDGMLDLMYEGPSVLREIIKKSKLGGMKSSNPVYDVISSNPHYSKVGLIDKSKSSIIDSINNANVKSGSDDKPSVDKEKVMDIEDTYKVSGNDTKDNGTKHKENITLSSTEKVEEEEEIPVYYSTWKYINNINRLKNQISLLVNSSTEKTDIFSVSENRSSSNLFKNPSDNIFEHYDLPSFRPNTKPSKTSSPFPEPSAVEVSFNPWTDQDVGKPGKVNLGSQKFGKPPLSGKPLTDSNIIWIFTTHPITISTPNYNDLIFDKSSTPLELVYHPVDDTSTEFSTKSNTNSSTTKMVNSILQTSLPETSNIKSVIESWASEKVSGMITSKLGLETTETLTTEAATLPTSESSSAFSVEKGSLIQVTTESITKDETFWSYDKKENENQSQSTNLPLAMISENPKEVSSFTKSPPPTTANVFDLIGNTRFKVRSSTIRTSTAADTDNLMVTVQPSPVGTTVATLEYSIPTSESATVSDVKNDIHLTAKPMDLRNATSVDLSSFFLEDKTSSKLASTSPDSNMNLDSSDASHILSTTPETSGEISTWLERTHPTIDPFTIQTTKPFWDNEATISKEMQIKESTMFSEVTGSDISLTEASTTPGSFEQRTDSTELFLPSVDSTINVFDSSTASTSSIELEALKTGSTKVTSPSGMTSDLLGVNIVVSTIDTKTSHSTTEVKSDTNHISIGLKVTNSTNSSVTSLQQEGILNTLYEFKNHSVNILNKEGETKTNNSDTSQIENHNVVGFTSTEGSVPLVQLNVWNYLTGNVKLKKPQVPKESQSHSSHNFLKTGINPLKDKLITGTQKEHIIIPSNLYEFVLRQSGNSSEENSTSDNKDLSFNPFEPFNVSKNNTEESSTMATNETFSITITSKPVTKDTTPTTISNNLKNPDGIRPFIQINHQNTNLNSNIYNNKNTNQNIININNPTSVYSEKARPTLFINNTEYNVNNGSNIIKTKLKVPASSTVTIKTTTQNYDKPTQDSIKNIIIQISTDNSLKTKTKQEFTVHSKNETEQTLFTFPSKGENQLKSPETLPETENLEESNLSKNKNEQKSSDPSKDEILDESEGSDSESKNRQNSTDISNSVDEFNKDDINESTDEEAIPFFSDVDSETLVNEYLKRVSIISKLFEKEDVKDPEISNMIENLALQSLLSYLLQRKTSNLTSTFDSKNKNQQEDFSTVITTTTETTPLPTPSSSLLTTSRSFSLSNNIDNTNTNSKISNNKNNNNEYAINIFSKLIFDTFNKDKSPNLLVPRPDSDLVNPINTKIETYISPSHININKPFSEDLMHSPYNFQNTEAGDTITQNSNIEIIGKIKEQKVTKKPSKLSYNYDLPTLLEEDYDLMDEYPFEDYDVKEEQYPPSSTNIDSQTSSNATSFTDTIKNSVTKVTQMISDLVPSDITFQKCLSSTGCAFALASSLAIGATGALAVPFVIPFGRRRRQMNTEESRIFYSNKNKELEEEFERILRYLAAKTGEAKGHSNKGKNQDGGTDKQNEKALYFANILTN
ncbi:hypothetical protein Anas_02574 [Armadillidium nasatum]|uniref:Uncharacterized protein n=1 Tax=Armadillidium nasatum TaxID=96803 RepID=A0A5N5SST1_9CRUS|nr:hypothetical protein Anas_02574 [Armadillidium nasatum]